MTDQVLLEHEAPSLDDVQESLLEWTSINLEPYIKYYCVLEGEGEREKKRKRSGKGSKKEGKWREREGKREEEREGKREGGREKVNKLS